MYQPVGQGQRGRAATFGGLRLTESLHLPDGRLDWHAHQACCLTLLLDGGMRESFRSQELDCRRGDLLVKPPEARHGTRFGSAGARCLIVELVDPAEGSLQACAPALGRVTRHPVDPAFTRRIVAELAARDTASDIVLEGIAMQLVGLAMRSTSTPDSSHRAPAWLNAIHDRVRSDYLGKLSIAELAATSGVHRDHLGRVFSRQYGCSIGDMVRDLRLSWAAEQLTETERELADVAVEAGFCDQSHFSRAFRRRFGMPPGRFRAVR